MSKQIFISYSRDDIGYATDLYDYLVVLKDRDPEVNIFWDIAAIESGERWKDKIVSSLASSDIFICLYSKHFFRSHFIKKVEMPAIVDRFKSGDCQLYGFLLDAYPYNDVTIDGLKLGDIQLLGPYDDKHRATPLNQIKSFKQDEKLNDVYLKLKSYLEIE